MGRTVAVVQARMGSRRLPGKVLASLAGTPVLAHVIARVRQATTVDDVVVATSVAAGDDPIAAWCLAHDVPCVRGSESDVLSRYALAAAERGADVIVRVTADCPLLSPAVVDAVVRARADATADYASNTLARGFPHGLDVECMTRAALDTAAAAATVPDEREHVTPYLYNRPDQFTLASVGSPDDWSWVRWTLDTPDDLRLLDAVLAAAPAALDPASDWRQTAAVVAASPALRAANAEAIAAADAAPSTILLH
jgi:spore coat polysaccharide biosynthesis protein SpsF (cytidylyltransferase family)